MMNKKTIRYAFFSSLPVMAGYVVLGAGFGILLNDKGYSFWWAFLMSLTIYAGSMQYVGVDLMAGGASLVSAALMTLMVNARHIFYGVSMVDKYREAGPEKPYLIFALTDETFSVVCDVDLPEGVEENAYYFWISLLDHSYWIIGSVAGALAGQMIPLDFTGIDFSMTALFTVILIDQIRGSGLEIRVPAMIGGIAAVVCLFIFGTDAFLLPALLLTVVAVAGLQAGSRKKKRADQKGPEAGTGEQV